jgi:protein-L-isoaspartate(D-aspartate) O-methyltransferase
MVEGLKRRGIRSPDVIAAMLAVPRHEFVPARFRDHAYEIRPLPIGLEQTISSPYIVAYMTEVADLTPDEKVLEIGTGSGYQAAVLAELTDSVYSIEILPELAEQALTRLPALGYITVRVRTGNGYLGWPEEAPFDAIVVTAAPDEVPQALVDQLAVGGRMVIPVGTDHQEMVVITRTPNGVVEKRTLRVRFVPMTGKPEGR